MKKIYLTGEKSEDFNLFVLVDDDDYEYLSKFKWHLNSGYANCTKLGLMHRVILQHKITAGMVCDHINGNKLDNRKYNLRVCTSSENNQNKSPISKSGYLGVSICRPKYKEKHYNEKYTSRIKINKQVIYLGIFDTKEEAAIAYDNAVLKFIGEKGKTNFNHG